jgi:hypothetical protein
MSADTSVEERLAALEKAVTDLRKELSNSRSNNPSPNWLEQITGSFKDDPAFEQALAYGREIRQADYPGEV